MMEKVGAWIYSVICCGILLSVVQSMLPKGVLKQIGMFAGGILLIITMVKPLINLDAEDLAIYISRLTSEQKSDSEQFSAQNEEMLKTFIAEECQAYILESAKELGIFCKVQVICNDVTEGIPVPDQVIILGALRPDEQEALAVLIEEDLGISRDSQIYEGQE